MLWVCKPLPIHFDRRSRGSFQPQKSKKKNLSTKNECVEQRKKKLTMNMNITVVER